MIGYMAMPNNFEYRDVYMKGQPRHQKFDPFWMKHPPMDSGHRAKIFAPFDALAGFSDSIAAKEILYEFKRELDDEEKEEIDRRLGILHRLTWNGKLARENKVPVSITYYVPCTDQDNLSYGYRGQYVTVTGICQKISMRSIRVDDTVIPFADVFSIETTKAVDGRNIFDTDWEVDAP